MRAVNVPVTTPFMGRDTLLRALNRHLGGEQAARLFLREVLSDSGYDAVPDAREPFQSFVREEVLPRLMPLMRLEQMHDLVRRTIGEEGSIHPFPLKPHGHTPGATPAPAVRPRVVVVERDAYRRIQISKALVSGGFDVEVVPGPQQVLGLEAFHALVMALDEEGEAVAKQLAAAGTRAGLVTYDDVRAKAAVKRTIDVWPSDRVVLVSRDATPTTLSARVKIVLS